MKVRILLHDVFGKGGGVLTVTLGLAEALAAEEDVEIVSLFGHEGEPVHRVGSSLPRTVLIDTTKLPTGAEAERLGLHEPTQVIPKGEPRYAAYSRHSDRVLQDYLSGLRGGALITMQPGLNIASARFGTSDVVRVAQDHRPFVGRSPAIRRAYARHAGNLDALLTLTAEDEKRYRELLGDATRVARMPNGNLVSAGPSATLDTKVAIAAGRLQRSKGFDLLVDAWRIVADEHPEWKLHIYGDGSEARALSTQIATLGLGEHVQLKGFSTELQTHMAQASLFVLSSRMDGTAMVLVEAMTCGVPVVSTNAPTGPAEIVNHGVDGLLVANQDVAALADGIVHMIELPLERRLAMGEAARANAAARSYPAVAERWRALLRECEAERRNDRGVRPGLLGRLRGGDDQPRSSGERRQTGGGQRKSVGIVFNPPAADEPERTYVIFGTRRGGTSMVAGVARALGLDLGEPGERKNNEDPRFHARPPRHLRKTVAARNQEQKVWGWKYPAAGSYLPDIYQELRNPYFIVVYRDPVAAALSQLRLDGGDDTRTARLALRESGANNATNTDFMLSTDRPCLVISHEKAIAHPRRLIDEVADFLQMPRPEGELRERILGYIKPGQYKSFDEFFATP